MLLLATALESTNALSDALRPDSIPIAQPPSQRLSTRDFLFTVAAISTAPLIANSSAATPNKKSSALWRALHSDPKEPVAVFWSTDRSALEPDVRRTHRASRSSAAAVICGWQPTTGTRSRLNGRIRASRTRVHNPSATHDALAQSPQSCRSASAGRPEGALSERLSFKLPAQNEGAMHAQNRHRRRTRT